MKAFIISFALVLIANFALNSEIEKVRLTWQPESCRGSCGDLIKKNFQKIKGPEDVQVFLEQGYAELYWAPGESFSYRMVKRPMQRVGVGLDFIYVTARGTISSQSKRLKLSSIGDSTSFTLISPANAELQRTGSRKNLRARSLNKEHRKILEDALKNKQLVKISGVLFQPHRSPPLVLEIHNLSVADPKENAS